MQSLVHDLFSNYNGQMLKTLPEVLWEITGGFADCGTGTWLRGNFPSLRGREHRTYSIASCTAAGLRQRGKEAKGALKCHP